jgi:hypothetical protein
MLENANNTSPTDETGALPPPGGEASTSKEPARGFLAAARRNLTAEELASPGALRLLIAELERLDQVCAEQQGIVLKYYDQRETIASLTERTQTSKWTEILFISNLSVGAAGIGAAPAYFTIADGKWAGVVVLALSLILVSLGVASRIKK